MSVLDDSNVTCTVTVSGGAMPIESQQTVTVASKIISNYSVETN